MYECTYFYAECSESKIIADTINRRRGVHNCVVDFLILVTYIIIFLYSPSPPPPLRTHTHTHTHTHTQSKYKKAPFKKWRVDGELAGSFKSGGGLTFLEVERAGHMVPADQPKAVS